MRLLCMILSYSFCTLFLLFWLSLALPGLFSPVVFNSEFWAASIWEIEGIVLGSEMLKMWLSCNFLKFYLKVSSISIPKIIQIWFLMVLRKSICSLWVSDDKCSYKLANIAWICSESFCINPRAINYSKTLGRSIILETSRHSLFFIEAWSI